MTAYEPALFAHLVGAIGFFAGLVLTAAAQGAAARRHRPSAIAAVLGLARVGVVVVAAGLLLVVASGLWLVAETQHSPGDGWLTGALALLAAAAVLGALGGRAPKQARRLAERRAAVVTRDSDGTRSVASAALALAGLVASYALAATTGLPGVVPDPEPVDGVAIACKAAESLGSAAASALLWCARQPVALTQPSTQGRAT